MVGEKVFLNLYIKYEIRYRKSFQAWIGPKGDGT